MRRLTLLAIAVLCAGCGGDATYDGSTRLAAVASGDTLTSVQLTNYLERVAPKFRNRQLADLLVQTWIDYTLLAHATAGGTDLADDAFTEPSLAPVRSSALTRQWHAALDRQRPPATDAELAAVYASDSVRVLDYLLWTLAGRDPRERAAEVKVQADSVHDRLVAGAAFGDVLATLKQRKAIVGGGRMLVTQRVQLIREFADVAWGLAPGEVSSPFATRVGVQIARRPALAEARAELVSYARAINTIRLDSLFVDSIGRRGKLTVAESAERETRRYLVGAVTDAPSVVVATWVGGSLSANELGPWLSALPLAASRTLYHQSDDQLSSLVLRIARDVLLARAAAAQGIVAPADTIALMIANYRADLVAVRAAAGLDDRQLTDSTQPRATRLALSRKKIDAFLDALAHDSVQAAPLPAGLQNVLRARIGFRLHPAGVAEALRRAAMLLGPAVGGPDSMRRVPGITPDP